MRKIEDHKYRCWIPDAGVNGLMVYYDNPSFELHCELVFQPNIIVKGWDLDKSF